MKIYRVSFLVKFLAGSTMCLTAIASSWDFSSLSCELGSSEEEHCRASIRHIEGGGMGYDEGYTTLEGFFSLDPEEGARIPFLDIRGHMFDNGYIATNIGVGFRELIGRRVYGLNAFYDFRDTRNIHYNQVGIGLETLGKFQDFRINAYLPVGKKTPAPDYAQFFKFSDHNLILSQKYKFAMKGADAEFGFHFETKKLFNLYAAVGPYYYIGEIGPGVLGGKARLKSKLGQYLELEASNSYDRMFRNNFQLQLIFTLPLPGKPPEIERKSDIARSRLVEPVEREEIVVVGNRKNKSAAIDPTTGQPFYFLFVDNTSHSEGTFNSPYPTLALAQENSSSGDIIYVLPGDGSTGGMDGGITLKSNQKLLGSGTEQQLQTTQGTLVIPAHSTAAPQITNSNEDGNGITLSSNNEISGLILKDVEGYGIYGVNSKNIKISSSTIDASGLDQIHLEYNEPGTVNLNNLVIVNGADKAISIDSTDASMVGVVSNTIIRGNTGSFVHASTTGETNFRVTNNTIDSNFSSDFHFSGASTLLVSGNSISNNTTVNGAPLSITAGGSVFSVTIEDNTINNSAAGGIYLALNDTSDSNLAIVNNTITNNPIGFIGSVLGSAIYVDPGDHFSGNSQLLLAGNVISGNGGSALYSSNTVGVGGGGFNNYQVTVRDNNIHDNGGAGIVFAHPVNTFTLVATDNIISDGGDHGIATGDSLMNIVNVTLSDNQITGNGGSANGIIFSHSGTDFNFTVADNIISNNGLSGLVLYPASNIENVVATIENNLIDGNQNPGAYNAAGGVDLENFTNMVANIKNNTFDSNAITDVFVGSTLASPTVCLTMEGNISDSGYILTNNAGVFNLAPLDIDTSNITEYGDITLVESCSGG